MQRCLFKIYHESATGCVCLQQDRLPGEARRPRGKRERGHRKLPAPSLLTLRTVTKTVRWLDGQSSSKWKKKKKKKRRGGSVDEQEKQKQMLDRLVPRLCFSFFKNHCLQMIKNPHTLRKINPAKRGTTRKKCNYWLINSVFPRTIPVNCRGSKCHVWIWCRTVGGRKIMQPKSIFSSDYTAYFIVELQADCSLIQIYSVHQMSFN